MASDDFYRPWYFADHYGRNDRQCIAAVDHQGTQYQLDRCGVGQCNLFIDIRSIADRDGWTRRSVRSQAHVRARRWCIPRRKYRGGADRIGRSTHCRTRLAGRRRRDDVADIAVADQLDLQRQGSHHCVRDLRLDHRWHGRYRPTSRRLPH